MGLIRAMTVRLQDLAPGCRGLESVARPLIQIAASGEAERLLNVRPPRRRLLLLLPRHAAPRIRRGAPRLKEGASGLLGLVHVAPGFLLVVGAQPRLLGLVDDASLGLKRARARPQRLTLFGDAFCIGHVGVPGRLILGPRLLFGGFCHLAKRAGDRRICRRRFALQKRFTFCSLLKALLRSQPGTVARESGLAATLLTEEPRRRAPPVVVSGNCWTDLPGVVHPPC